MKLKHAMIDIETMGLTPNAAIVSIGAVLFDPRYGKLGKEEFYIELDWEAQGRLIDQGTKAWWNSDKVDDKAREALYGMDDLDGALKELDEFLPKDVKVWGNGPTFDMVILEDAYRQCEMVVPWHFWNIRDCRTIKDLYESKRGGFDKKSGGTLHNALDDAKMQAKYVTMMWRKSWLVFYYQL